MNGRFQNWTKFSRLSLNPSTQCFTQYMQLINLKCTVNYVLWFFTTKTRFLQFKTTVATFHATTTAPVSALSMGAPWENQAVNLNAFVRPSGRAIFAWRLIFAPRRRIRATWTPSESATMVPSARIRTMASGAYAKWSGEANFVNVSQKIYFSWNVTVICGNLKIFE